MSYWFKFQIPTNSDGTRVSYSPNYHGTMPHCPRDVTILLYNDKEGYGIAQTEDTFIPKEVTVLTSKVALATLADVKVRDGVYIGQAIVDRWDVEEVLNGR